MRYPQGSRQDFSCLVELGVTELTQKPGFNQFNGRGDLYGMLSAHSSSPLLSLRQFDAVKPIFLGMSQTQVPGNLFKSVNFDPARILQ